MGASFSRANHVMRVAVEASEWCETAKIAAGSALTASKTLVVFDFDCTLASLHMFFALRSAEGQTELRQDADTFFNKVFGGEARRTRLALHLRRLKTAGATLVILSNGVEAEINAALTSAGLRDFFSAVMGAETQNAAAADGKPAMLARIVLERGSAAPEFLIFLDDDLQNYPGQAFYQYEEPPSEGSCWQLQVDAKALAALSQGKGGAPTKPCTMVAWPVVPAAGVSNEAMDRLEALLGASGPELPPGL